MPLTVNCNDNLNEMKENILSLVSNIIAENNAALSEQFTQNLATHLAIATLRIKSSNYIPLSQGQIASYKANDSYELANVLCDKVSDVYGVAFPESERALVSIYLSKNNMLDIEFNAGFNLLDDEIFIVLQNTLNTLFIKEGIDLRNNEKLLVSLGLHLTPAIDRLLDDDQIENPLLDKIKERHPKEFAIAQLLNDAIESVYHKRFIDDEVGYFALHFIVSMKNNKESE